MKIQIRTLSHSIFDLEVESTFTIERIKELIEEKTRQSKTTQTLIFAGKLLANESTLEGANIKDNDFLVLVSKKGPAKPATGPSVPTTQPTPAVSSSPAPSGVEGAHPQTTTTPAETPAAAPVNTANTTSSSTAQPQTGTAGPEATGLYSESAQALVTGTQFQSVVDEISSSMGFPKEQVVIALRASFGNPDRAVDYLLSGEIPESVLSQTQQAAPQARPNTRPPTASPQTPQTSQPQNPQPQTTPARTTPQTPAPTQQQPQQQTNAPARPTTTQPRVLMTGGVVLPENIIPPALASQIPNLRPPSTPASAPGQVPRATPGATPPGGGQNLFSSLRDNPMFSSLQQLARSNPQRFRELMNQLIQSNPQLGQLLAQHQNEFLQLFQGGGGGGGGGGLRPPGIQLQITPQDQEALERLTALGFSRNRVIEAYFLFEKSEDAAANYLLNTKDDEDEMEFLEGDMEDDDNPDDAN